MKHKFWLSFVLVFMLAFAGFGTIKIKNSQDITISNAATTSFEISNSSSGFADVLLGGNPVSNTATNFDELLDVLNQNLSNPDDIIEINFSNFELSSNEKINLSSGNYIFSGTITSTSVDEIININANEALSLTLSNLTLSAQNASKIVKVESTSNPATLVLDSVSFNSSLSKSYGILFESTNHNLSISGNNVHTSTYLYNHTPGLTTQAPTELTNTSKLKIEVTYNANNNVVVSGLPESNFEKFELVSSHDFISVTAVTRNISNLVSIVSTNLAFDLNGGQLKNGQTLTTNFIFNDVYSFDFEKEENLERDHSIFYGWFGKITLSDTEKNNLGLNTNTLYFDSNILKTFVESNYDFSKLATTLADCESQNSFTNYLYDSSKTDFKSFWNVFAFLNLGKKPEFVAKWEYITYTINYVTGDGTAISPLVAKYNDVIAAPTAPELLGHTFTGWFTNPECTVPYTFTTMGEDLTLYAGWTADEHTLTLVFNNGETNQTITADYGTAITLPTPTKIACSFDGWFDSNGNPFTQTTMPAEDLTLTAKWTDIEYYIYFVTNGGTEIKPLYAKYNEPISKPADPTKTGYRFLGWYIKNTDFIDENRFVFDKMPLGGDTIYARWSVNTYTITLDSQLNTPLLQISADYGSKITLPTPNTSQSLKKANHTFDGWADEFGNLFTQTTMPATNLNLYAVWTKKASVDFVEEYQNFDTSENIRYTPKSSLSGFIVEYYVNGMWTDSVPTNAGSYDVKISRLEDDTYASFEKVIKNGLIISHAVKDFTWLIVLLFVLGFMEIVATIMVKIMHRIKSSAKSIVPFMALSLPISDNQLVLVIVAGVFALVCFVVMVYEIVKLIRANPTFEQEITDINRSQMANVHKKEAEISSQYERFSKYSADDVESMLSGDSFEKDLKSRNKKYSPDTQTNESEYQPRNDYFEEVEYIDDEFESEDQTFDEDTQNDEEN